ncbi:unnamed protein product [Didymodactylos carnosus]|uniref:Uncharacterized protein n=1 Tax=Didymodactylos carnosus TaxID=1234261 RepID=A0A815NAZ1_9BILA|nr:unnamed protein product [Didymodactylos carnosus]CAF1436865.1 unnamed protein product [Didymodactylos carnosus]CAF3787481.1 unnamed protein product [Didymodactylos carnosus]CAF4314217.1 unnamed protein product [Didymodactylos carnosus]
MGHGISQHSGKGQRHTHCHGQRRREHRRHNHCHRRNQNACCNRQPIQQNYEPVLAATFQQYPSALPPTAPPYETPPPPYSSLQPPAYRYE